MNYSLDLPPLDNRIYPSKLIRKTDGVIFTHESRGFYSPQGTDQVNILIHYDVMMKTKNLFVEA
jgi:hypothetical protein